MVSCLVISLSASAVVGVVLIIVGGSVLGVLPRITQDKIKEGLVLTNGSEAADRFISSPVANYMKFYIFSVKNKDAANKGETPELEEKGPYVYRQQKTKNILKWKEENGTVIYTETTEYHFEPGMSKGTLDDPINHVNAVAIGLRYDSDLVYFWDSTGPGKFKEFLESLPPDYIVTHTVNELLFGGYSIKEYLPSFLAAMCPALPQCNFGFYVGRNGTNNVQNEVRTGADDIKTIGQYVTYNNQPLLKFWEDPYCNAINGTDGKQFAPWMEDKPNLYVFSSDICRSMMFEYEKDVIVEKIDTYRYVVPPVVFSDPNEYQDNMCFCKREPAQEKCPSKKGVFSIATCQKNKPVAVSAPHYYLGEQEYVENFVGLKPEKEKHQTFLDVEQLTGTVISAAKRIQINMIVQKFEDLKMLQNVKKPFIYFPVFWAEEGGRIDEKNAEDFRDKVTGPYKSAKWGMVAMIIIGSLVVLLSLAFGLFKRNSK